MNCEVFSQKKNRLSLVDVYFFFRYKYRLILVNGVFIKKGNNTIEHNSL